MITGIQIKAARKLLGWSQGVLAGHAGLSVIAIGNVERGRGVSDSVVRVIREALEAAGVEFAESVPRADAAPANLGEPAAPVSNAEVCKHEADELSHIRAAPDRAAAQRFASQLKCSTLKAQAARLLESIGD